MNKIKINVYVVGIILSGFVSSCTSNNDLLFVKFQKEFYDSVNFNNAKKFEFTYDGLVPQKSYFVGSKLKYLEYIHRSENGSIQSLVYFDRTTDSINKIVRRKIKCQADDKLKDATGEFTDTMVIVRNDQGTMAFYSGGILLKASFNKKEFDTDKEFIKAMKISTETNYNINKK